MITLKINMVTTQDLFTGTYSLMHEMEDVYEDYSKNKEMLDFSNYSAESNCHDSNEFAKLRAFRAYVPYVPMHLTCLRAFVPQISTCLRAYIP